MIQTMASFLSTLDSLSVMTRIQRYHNVSGHVGESVTLDTSPSLGWIVLGHFNIHHLDVDPCHFPKNMLTHVLSPYTTGVSIDFIPYLFNKRQFTMSARSPNTLNSTSFDSVLYLPDTSYYIKSTLNYSPPGSISRTGMLHNPWIFLFSHCPHRFLFPVEWLSGCPSNPLL